MKCLAESVARMQAGVRRLSTFRSRVVSDTQSWERMVQCVGRDDVEDKARRHGLGWLSVQQSDQLERFNNQVTVCFRGKYTQMFVETLEWSNSPTHHELSS
jgi:hypothetical protein